MPKRLCENRRHERNVSGRLSGRRRQYFAQQRPDSKGPRRASLKRVRCNLSGPLLEDPRGSLRAVGLSRLPRGLTALSNGTSDRHSLAGDVLLSGRLPFRRSTLSQCARRAEATAKLGPTVILSDGDVVFQPRKVERSGISEAVSGHVLIYIHKEAALSDVERRSPAAHYVMVDDKVRILAAVKKEWGDHVTTVFPRQGKFAHDPNVLAAYASPDVTIEFIGDLLSYELSKLVRKVLE